MVYYDAGSGRVYSLNAGFNTVLGEGEALTIPAQVNILFYLILFNTLIRTHFLPVPLMRLVYLALGAKLGHNTYSAGVLLDPPLTFVGDNCIIGNATGLAGEVKVEDWAILSGGTLVHQFTRIGAHVIVGGGSKIRIDVPLSSRPTGTLFPTWDLTPWDLPGEDLKKKE